MLDDLLPLIGTYGFPIFVALWFMWRVEKFLANNTTALTELTQVVKTLCEKMSDHV